MQRYAFSQDGERIEAAAAMGQVDYRCPECGGVVRVRKGEERVPHFFHRNEGLSCRLRLKDGLHQTVQSWLVRQLSPESCVCECHFPQISRVADVAFFPQKIVFEVQVSPISAEEAIARTRDYWRLGWHVIWLLHVQTYGRAAASSFEASLGPIPHYFTSIGWGGGSTWDEVSVVRGSRRQWLFFPPKRQKLEEVNVSILRLPSDRIPDWETPRTSPQCLRSSRKPLPSHGAAGGEE